MGKERGIIQGTVFTVWKDKKEAAVSVFKVPEKDFCLLTFFLVLENPIRFAQETQFTLFLKAKIYSLIVDETYPNFCHSLDPIFFDGLLHRNTR